MASDDVRLASPEKLEKVHASFPDRAGSRSLDPEPPAGQMAEVVGIISGLQLFNPDLLRAVPAWVALRHLRRLCLRPRVDFAPADLFALSCKVTSIGEFWSHSWRGRLSTKLCLLLMLRNGSAAVCLGTVAALFVAVLSYQDLLPGWYKAARVQGFDGEVKTSPWAVLSGLIVASLMLLLWRSGVLVFLDQICIHQSNAGLKAQALAQLGAFLKNSRKLAVVWDPTYLSRAWCVFELAAFLHTHNDEKPAQVVVKPIVFAPAVLVIAIGGVLLMAFEICLPSLNLFTLMKAVYLVAWGWLVAHLLEDFWRHIDVAEEQFGTFSWQSVTCDCCSRNHLLPDGTPISCDKEMLTHCLVQWFGSQEAFEERVRTSVRDSFLGPITRGFPLGFWWQLGANSYVAWGMADVFASRAHAGAGEFAVVVPIHAVVWWVWLAPSQYFTLGLIARWIHKKHAEKLSRPAACAVMFTRYFGYAMNCGLPHLYQRLLQMVLDPMIAALVFTVTTFCWAAVAYRMWAKPSK